MSRRVLAGLAICGSLVAGAGCGWGPVDVSPEPVIVTVTDSEFRVSEDYIHGQVAILIENQTRELLWYADCGNVLDRLGRGGQWQRVWNTFCLLRVEEVSISPGEVLETSQFISATIAEDAMGWEAVSGRLGGISGKLRADRLSLARIKVESGAGAVPLG